MPDDRLRRLLGWALLAAVAAVAGVLLVRHAGGGAGSHSWLRASSTLTPGVSNPAVTQATIRSTICKRGWTRTIRPPTAYTTDLKRRQIAAWGLPGTVRDYQEDHLISLELGGHPTDERNLWPEPHPYAEQVDTFENALNRKVCSGRLTLARAQAEEARRKHRSG